MKVYLRSLDDQTQFQIEEGENLLLGRLDQCDVVLSDGSVSSQHARLSLSDGVLVVADLESTNGTRVNYSLLVEPMPLLDGDTVEFGNVTFTVDGPGLRSGGGGGTDSAFVNEFKPLDLSGPLDATMQLSAISDDDLMGSEDTPPSVQTNLEAVMEVDGVPVQDASAEVSADVVPNTPVTDSDSPGEEAFDVCRPGRLLVTLLMFLLFSALMGLYLWRYVPEL